jgi:hypothetical protein
MSTTVSPTPISEHELERAERANATMGKFGMTSISKRENREIEAAKQVDREKREDEDDLAG